LLLERQRGVRSDRGTRRLSDRDMELLVRLARYRYLTVRQVAGQWGVSVGTVRGRVRELAAAGLVQRWSTGQVNLIGVTGRGLDLLGATGWGVAEPAWGAVPHMLGVGDVGLWLEGHGLRVVGELEVRGVWRATRMGVASPIREVLEAGRKIAAAGEVGVRGVRVPWLLTPAPDPGPFVLATGGNGWHIPDLVISGARRPDGVASSIAVEIELSKKMPADIDRILGAYRAALPGAGRGGVFGKVVYYTPDERLARWLRRRADRLHMGDTVEVHVMPMPSIVAFRTESIVANGHRAA
jgi:hypothetical protein